MSTKSAALPVVLAFLVAPGAAQTWQSGPALPTGGQPRIYAAGVRLGNDVFALGGTPFTVGGNGAAHQLANGAATWTIPESTEGAFLHVGAAVDVLNRIIVFGGEDAAQDPGEHYHWTPGSGNNGGIAERSGQAPAKLFAVAVDAQGRIYSIGGGSGAAPTPAHPNSSRVERYDATADLWTVLAPLPAPVADAAACSDGQGHVLVIGGFDAAGVRTANVVRFDVATGSWSDTAVPDLPAPRSGLRAVLGADNRIYAIGGSDGVIQPTTFVLDPGTLTWTIGPALATPRQHFACVVGPGGWIWAIGGSTPSGGTGTTEKLLTPTCPSVTVPPAPASVYAGSGLGLFVQAAGSAPLAYQWRKDGVPLANGPSAGGGTVSGATTAQLGVAGVGAADSGAYDCVVGNACGSATSAAATVSVLPPPPIPAAFGSIGLHPAAALSSTASTVDGTSVGGSARYPHPTWSSLDHPMLWSTTGGPVLDLTPSNSVGGAIYAIENGVFAGWWWWPYTNQYGTGYYRHACAWLNGGATHVDVQLSGWEIGSLADTDGVHHAGSLTWDETSTNSGAFYWPNTSGSAIPLTPGAAWGSGAAAIDGGRQFGSVHLSYGVVHAAMWQGTAASFVDLHPAGASASGVSGAGSGQQVGGATFGGVSQAVLWSGSAASAVSLHPAGAASSSASDTESGFQVGTAAIGGFGHAMLWRGSAGTATDLQAFLPSHFTASYASDVDVDGKGVITIAGTAWNSLASRYEAVLWRGSAVALSQDVSQVSASAGGTVHMALFGGAALAGRFWWLAGSVSGTSPGVPVSSSLVVPLNVDDYTLFTISSPNTLIVPSTGVLDAAGFAAATATLPPSGISLLGPITAHHAFVVFSSDLSTIEFASNAAPTTLLP